ncbi:MAG: sigma-70 family RNA polymerase sigma factor [Candidatus Eisenbacteria bacterium]|uniref:Sigma-70 family RNA polymerase sigma factor n=1 Tax=Eiseniibacteriota bacterium TaxID=2212470 RepID=A0A956M0Q8_UNCEI|nr:sigma-70 family RNA polymerase sigma factor [Candidatus Eisenbacteria bacterium]
MTWATTQPSLLLKLRNTDDQAAWHRFDARYGHLIVAYARRRGLNLADAEDVRQIVFLNLVRSMPQFRFQPDRGRFRSYLGRVVGNVIERVRQRPYRRVEVLEVDERVASIPDLDQPLDGVWHREWENHHLRRALAAVRKGLDPRSVDVFERLLQGVPVARVAEDSGMTVEAVHKIKQRIRDRLKQRVAMQLAEESFL